MASPDGRAAWKECAAAALVISAMLVAVPLGAGRTVNPCTMTRMRPAYRTLTVDFQACQAYELLQYCEWGHCRDAAVVKVAASPRNASAAVLFVPGNGGSYAQVRSLGHEVALAEKQDAYGVQTDVYAVNLGEELSAFDGAIIERQAAFVAKCVARLVDQGYGTVTLVGHSMGGVIAALVAKRTKNVDAVVTLAAPHAAHPFAASPKLAAALDRSLLWSFTGAAAGSVGPRGDWVLAAVAGGLRDWQVPERATAVGHGDFGMAFSSTARSLAVDADHQCICWCNELVVALCDAVRETHQAAAGAANAAAARLERFAALRRHLRPNPTSPRWSSANALAAVADEVSSAWAAGAPWAAVSLGCGWLAPKLFATGASASLGAPYAYAAGVAFAFELGHSKGDPSHLRRLALAVASAVLHAALLALARPLALRRRRGTERRPVAALAALVCFLVHPALGLAFAALSTSSTLDAWCALALVPTCFAAASAAWKSCAVYTFDPFVLLRIVDAAFVLVFGPPMMPHETAFPLFVVPRQPVASLCAAWCLVGAVSSEPHRLFEAAAFASACNIAGNMRRLPWAPRWPRRAD